jgi:hypothetical protein
LGDLLRVATDQSGKRHPDAKGLGLAHSKRRNAVIAVIRATAPGISDTDLERYATTIILNKVIHSLDPTVGRRGTKPALKSLNDVHKKALALFKAIDELGQDERFALQRMQAPSPTDLLRAVAEINSHIVAAYSKIDGEPIVPTRKKPKKLAAAGVSQNAARIYQQIMGKEPTWDSRGPNPYGTFLQGIFSALEIDASAEGFAKAARAGKKRTNKS